MSTEEQKFNRRLTTARREIRKAVERAAEVDMLEGHRMEALRLAQQVRDEAEALVKLLKEEN